MAAFAGGHMQTITNYFAENFGGKRATLRHLRNLAAYVAGRFSRHERLDATRIERLVFVCKGNICRSAYAHAVASARGLRAASFGLDTPGDEPADPVAARNALARGVSLATHRTSSSRSFALEPTDLLVVMEPEQAQELELLEGRHQQPVNFMGHYFAAPRHIRCHERQSAGGLPEVFGTRRKRGLRVNG